MTTLRINFFYRDVLVPCLSTFYPEEYNEIIAVLDEYLNATNTNSWWDIREEMDLSDNPDKGGTRYLVAQRMTVDEYGYVSEVTLSETEARWMTHRRHECDVPVETYSFELSLL